MKKNNNQLKSWLFNQPVIFTLFSFLSVFIFVLVYSLFNINVEYNSLFALVLFLIPFIFPVCYMIKKLPSDNMYRNDFIAIVNGASIISLLSSLVAIPILIYYGKTQEQILWLYATQPVMFNIYAITFIAFALYLLGLAVSGIYAKYKRCKEIGIASWKIILSMPFAFFMLWTPGYLIEEKTKKSNLEIKSKWYKKFNTWVLSSFNNVLFVFLFITICKTIIAGISAVVLYFALLIIYTLWSVKHKTDFIKNINNGYALTAVGINIAIIAAIIYSIMALGGNPY